MPKQSRRAKSIKRLRNYFKERLKFRVIRRLVVDEDDDDDDIHDVLDGFIAVQLDEVESQRYQGPRGQYRKRQSGRFEDDLGEGTGEEPPWLNADEFQQKYRCSHQSFHAIVDLIKDHPIFKEEGRKHKPQAPPAHQLMVLLKYLGTEGSGTSNSDLRSMFGIGKGTAEVYKERAVKAI
jgi:hypothetical protein